MMASPAVLVSFHTYRALLFLYPRRFREEYGREMALVFRDCCRDAQRNGAGSLRKLWRAALVDLITNAVKEHVFGRAHATPVAWGFGRMAFRCPFCSEEIVPSWRRCPYCGATMFALAGRRTLGPPPRSTRRPAGYLMAQIATNAERFYDWAHGEPEH
jgi:hypothetical protein